MRNTRWIIRFDVLRAETSIKAAQRQLAAAEQTREEAVSRLRADLDLNGPIEVVIGPYEVYEDNLFNYKASFESFVTVVDGPESAKLAAYAHALPDMERNLPETLRQKFVAGADHQPVVLPRSFVANIRARDPIARSTRAGP